MPRRSTRHRRQKIHGVLKYDIREMRIRPGKSLTGTKIKIGTQRKQKRNKMKQNDTTRQRHPGLGEIPGRTRKSNAENISSQKNTKMPGGTRMGNKTSRMGDGERKYRLYDACAGELQQEIGRRNQKLRRQENASNYRRYYRRGNRRKDIPRILPTRSNMPNDPIST